MVLPSAPAWALLAGAALWGVVWYPYRLLAAAGIDGISSTVLTYGLALVVGTIIFRRHIPRRVSPLAILMGLAIGWSNLAYVLGVLEGEVMRVLLLFYLAPLWTVPLARLLLRERLDRTGFVVMALAFAGAMTMLWHPQLGFPWPRNRAEWLGMAAGFLFALGNVLVRRLHTMSDAEKSIVIWAGVTLAGLIHLPQAQASFAQVADGLRTAWPIAAGIGVSLVAMSYSLQYGLSRMAANRAIVILLSELVIAAFAAYFLAGEMLRPQDWIAGALIIPASLVSAAKPPEAAPAPRPDPR
ncbi:MAG: EamA family transporter [Betaproteobacteria bacterium]